MNDELEAPSFFKMIIKYLFALAIVGFTSYVIAHLPSLTDNQNIKSLSTLLALAIYLSLGFWLNKIVIKPIKGQMEVRSLIIKDAGNFTISLIWPMDCLFNILRYGIHRSFN